MNWSPHHYDIIQWTVNPDPNAPIEVTYENKGKQPGDAIIHYRYSNGVQVHSTSYPGESVGNDGGACFVGTEGRIAVDRDSIVSYPASILNQPLRPADSPGLSRGQPFGQLPGVRAQPAPDDLQPRSRHLYHQRDPHRRHIHDPEARAHLGPGEGPVRRRRRGQPASLLHPPAALAVLSHTPNHTLLT